MTNQQYKGDADLISQDNTSSTKINNRELNTESESVYYH